MRVLLTHPLTAQMVARPWLTGLLTATAIGVIGDAIIQVRLEGKSKLDARRLAETALVRGVFGAFIRAYYMQLERLCAGWPMLAKLALNELVGTWIVHAFLLSVGALVRGQDVRAALAATPQLVTRGMRYVLHPHRRCFH